jgi:hypothetical protein
VFVSFRKPSEVPATPTEKQSNGVRGKLVNIMGVGGIHGTENTCYSSDTRRRKLTKSPALTGGLPPQMGATR